MYSRQSVACYSVLCILRWRTFPFHKLQTSSKHFYFRRPSSLLRYLVSLSLARGSQQWARITRSNGDQTEICLVVKCCLISLNKYLQRIERLVKGLAYTGKVL
jgi:hypothetical protein